MYNHNTITNQFQKTGISGILKIVGNESTTLEIQKGGNVSEPERQGAGRYTLH